MVGTKPTGPGRSGRAARSSSMVVMVFIGMAFAKPIQSIVVNRFLKLSPNIARGLLHPDKKLAAKPSSARFDPRQTSVYLPFYFETYLYQVNYNRLINLH
jgi:hypothetical protein